jgi:hypothetical protein
MRIDPEVAPTAEVLEDARLAGAVAGVELAGRLIGRRDNDTVMYELALQAAAARGAEETLDVLVANARQQGRSWSEIAAALGVTKQAAHQRYRVLEEARPARS